MNMTIDIPDEMIDAIMEEQLVNSYNNIKADVARLKKLKDIKPHEKDDLANDTALLAAMEIVGSYYVWNFKKKVKAK